MFSLTFILKIYLFLLFFNKESSKTVKKLLVKTKKTGEGLAEFAKRKLGTPYFYGTKMEILSEDLMSILKASFPRKVTSKYIKRAKKKNLIGKEVTDCSGLIQAYRNIPQVSRDLCLNADKKFPISEIEKFPIGTVLWKYRHVSVYIGKINGTPKCIEAKGMKYGVVMSNVTDNDWKYGLAFNDIIYNDTHALFKESKNFNIPKYVCLIKDKNKSNKKNKKYEK